MDFKRIVQTLYPTYSSDLLVDQLLETISAFQTNRKPQLKLVKKGKFSKKLILTVYPDTFVDGKKRTPSLPLLDQFVEKYHLERYFNVLHILPFHPWDVDRGFSIIDYYKVDGRYGDWGDIANLAKRFELMSGLVLNHVSIESRYAQGALIFRHIDKGHPAYNQYLPYQDFLIAFSDEDKPSNEMLSKVNRPRRTPLLTHYICYEKEGKLKAVLGDDLPVGSKFLGSGWVWTTFSRPKNSDGTEATKQVDLNYKNPQVLWEIINVLLFYVQQGIRYVRLDAAAMIWKELGTDCVYRSQSYQIIALLRAVLDSVYPEAKLVVEAKTSPEQMRTYLDRGNRGVDYVFQYAFFPLYLYCQIKNDFRPFKRWLKAIAVFGEKQITTIFGSHDGLELKALQGIISEAEIAWLARFLRDKRQALANWARWSGKKHISEVCSSPWELVNGGQPQGSFAKFLNRYLSVLRAGLTIPGIGDIYINGLLGVKKYFPAGGLDENRTVNRERFKIGEITQKIDNKNSREHRVFYGVLGNIKALVAGE